MLSAQRRKLIKNRLKSLYRRARMVAVRLIGSYGGVELVAALQAAGVQSGDTLMLHSAFEPHHGFRGTCEEAVDAFLQAVGPQGNLMMVSLPYRSSSLEYLRKGKTFDVRKTPSAMGLVSECFRRRKGVLRSLHPTHPVLAYGARAEWLTEGHECCLYPCGPRTPFEKALRAYGKVAFFNVPFAFLTFFHYLEHQVHGELDFNLYAEPPFDAAVIDRVGERRVVRTYVFSKEAIQRRRFEVLEGALRKRGLIREIRVGASSILLANLRDIVIEVEDMTRRGVYFYESTAGPVGKV